VPVGPQISKPWCRAIQSPATSLAEGVVCAGQRVNHEG
jgi:hypothetical protein